MSPNRSREPIKTRPSHRLLAKLADKLGFVSRSELEPLWDAQRELLDATARKAWAAGSLQTALALHRALADEDEHTAKEAPRGITHLSPTLEADPKSAETIEEAAANVELHLRELGLQDLIRSDRRELGSMVPTDLLVRALADDHLIAVMVRQARWFVLRYGRQLSKAEAYERLDSSTSAPRAG